MKNKGGDFEKKSRQKIIAFSKLLLLEIKTHLISLVNLYSSLNVKEEKYQAECSVAIKIQIRGFTTMLNSNDLKQFFMAKMPQYVKANIEKQLEALTPTLNELLSELKTEYSQLRRIRHKLKILRKVSYKHFLIISEIEPFFLYIFIIENQSR